MGSSRDRWITPFALTVVGLGVAAIFIGPQIAKGGARTAMIDSCKSAVATWAGVDVGTLSDRDVSGENIYGDAWDFRGSYPGGTWACGGAAGEREPAQIVAYPDGGIATVISP